MTDFSLATFGQSLDDLEYQDIANYFTEDHGEGDNIEFKAYSPTYGNFNANIKGIIRAICGLLNSNGGLVVWGAPLGVVDPTTNEKKFQGQLASVPDFREKDWIINKVSDNITPLPVGIKVRVLQQGPNENLYILEVQPSPYKPHQFENTYFVRLDGQTKPAPHYFIEALFRRISYPNIEGYLKFNLANLNSPTSQYYVDITILLFNFSQLQNEENVIYRLTTFPGKIQSQQNSSDSHNFIGKEDVLHFGTPIMNHQRILLTPHELNQSNFQVNLVLTIGGKKSPVKASDYTLNLRNIDLTAPQNTAQLIVEKNENQLLSEKQQQLGTTRETTLASILGRPL